MILNYLTRILMSLIAVPMLLFTDCGKPVEPDPNAMNIMIECRTETPIMCVTADYSLDGVLRSSSNVMNARSDKPLPKDDTLRFDCLPEDLGGLDAEDHTLTVAITVTDAQNERHEAGRYTCSIGFGDTHWLTLTESSGAYALIPLEKD